VKFAVFPEGYIPLAVFLTPPRAFPADPVQ
jgi:hypothetical protein